MLEFTYIMGLMKANSIAMVCVSLVVGFLVATLMGSTSRQFKRVEALVYTVNAQEGGVERLMASSTRSGSSCGEYGVDMTGSIHDGYLELVIKRENGSETRIVPVDHLSQLVFKD